MTSLGLDKLRGGGGGALSAFNFLPGPSVPGSSKRASDSGTVLELPLNYIHRTSPCLPVCPLFRAVFTEAVALHTGRRTLRSDSHRKTQSAERALPALAALGRDARETDGTQTVIFMPVKKSQAGCPSGGAMAFARSRPALDAAALPWALGCGGVHERVWGQTKSRVERAYLHQRASVNMRGSTSMTGLEFLWARRR